jgi:hypothetical protein
MIRKLFALIFLLVPFFSIGQCELTNLTSKSQVQIDLPSFIVQNIEYQIEVRGIPNGEFITIKAQGNVHTIKIEDSYFKYKFDHSDSYKFVYKKSEIKKDLKVMPLWYSIIPPLLAILFAMLFKEVLTALLIGLLSGTAAISFFSGVGNVVESIGVGLLDIIDNRVIHTIADADHASVMVFSLLIGAVVQIIRKNGGMRGLVERLARKVDTRKKVCFSLG